MQREDDAVSWLKRRGRTLTRGNRMRGAAWMGMLAGSLACSAGPSSNGDGRACVPGAQQQCGCAGGAVGAQVCNRDGTGFDPCLGCPSHGGSSSSALSSGGAATSQGTGASVGALSGPAAFDVQRTSRFSALGPDGGESLGVFLFDDGSYCLGRPPARDMWVAAVTVEGDVPALGEHPIGTDAQVQVYLIRADGGIDFETLVYGVAGTLNLVSATRTTAEGGFNAMMRTYAGQDAGPLVGTFAAHGSCWP